MDDIEKLKAQKALLEAKLKALEAETSGETCRPKIAEMSGEVVDSNPYR